MTLPGPHFQGKPFVLCLGNEGPGESQSNKRVDNRIIRAEGRDKLPRCSWLRHSVHPRPMKALFFQAIQETKLLALKIQLTGRYDLNGIANCINKGTKRALFLKKYHCTIRVAPVKELSDSRLVTSGSALHQDLLTGQTEIIYAMRQGRAILNCLFS